MNNFYKKKFFDLILSLESDKMTDFEQIIA